jgi:aminoglycoside phosphotransferase (APT) family kinase protein
MVPGQCDRWALFQRCQTDPDLTRKIGRSIGGILAEQHTAVSEADIAEWLPERVAWPESGDWMRERLLSVVDDSDLLDQIDRVIDCYDAVTVGVMDRALIHGDVGLHNLAVDPKTDVVNGIFDYDSAAWADRHHDFRYLLFDVECEDMLDTALDVYEPLVGRSIDRDRVRLYNAACAISYLAFRVATPPQAKSCGRTLAEDLRWVRTALTKCQMPSSAQNQTDGTRG